MEYISHSLQVEAVERLEEMLPPGHLRLATALNVLGCFYDEKHDYDPAGNHCTGYLICG